jgi:hypothetical protein
VSPAGQGNGASATDREREIRRDFAVQYLEKLVNIEVPVPPATALQLGELIASTGREGDLEATRRRRQRWLRSAGQAAAVLAIGGGLGLVFTLAKHKGMEDLAAARRAPVPAGQMAGPVAADLADGAAGGSRARRASSPPVVAAGFPGDFVPGEPAPTSRTLLVFCVLLVLGGGLVAILRRPVVTVYDSTDFTEALNAWSPLIYTRRNTPRGIKKFLNRVRFYAMRQEAHHPTETQWDRVVGWMKRQPRVGAVVRWFTVEPEGHPARARVMDESGATIPEEVLVALSSIQECRADWLEEPALYENFPGFIQKNAVEPLPETVQEHLDRARFWGPLTRYRERFKRLSTGLRIG